MIEQNTDKDTELLLKQFIDCFTQSLLDEMVSNNIIKETSDALRPDEQAYSLVFEQADGEGIDNIPSKKKENLNNLNLFKSAIKAVGHALNIKNSKISNIISDLKDSNTFINSSSEQIDELIKIIDINSELLSTAEIQNGIINTIENYKINFSQLINDVLKFYTHEKAVKVFPDKSFGKQAVKSTIENSSFDIIGISNNQTHDTLFGVKYRRKNISSYSSILYQYVDSLAKYDKKSNKENILFILVFTFEESKKNEEIKYRFNKDIEDLFPEFAGRIIFLPLNVNSIYELGNKLDECLIDSINVKRKVEILFKSNPYLVPLNEKYQATSAFIQSQIGSFACWVKVPPLSFFCEKPMNNIYIIGHDTSNGQAEVVNGENVHANAWGFCLSPNKFNTLHKVPPTSVHWRLWTSNEKYENFYLKCPAWKEKETKWHHFFIRWNHNNPSLELFFDGILIDSSNTYLPFWPKLYFDYVSVGSWLNNHKYHHLNMELYRTVFSQIFLNDSWLKNELNRNCPS